VPVGLNAFDVRFVPFVRHFAEGSKRRLKNLAGDGRVSYFIALLPGFFQADIWVLSKRNLLRLTTDHVTYFPVFAPRGVDLNIKPLVIADKVTLILRFEVF
jgi:hypothetical protein